ncbi:MAG: tRNA (adenine-N(1)-)-methyltransferase catalytic subunit trm61 [Candelina submexicana]|nr:MAG: tRNA (adenine-N(1)-)-methyltransferase catalytic subunit trm61 [Candelina submexicana]
MAATENFRPSPFLDPGLLSQPDSLAVLHLKRDLLLPTKLQERDDKDEGYDEGRVTNTRFGSFPHSTLIGLPWGSQVRASEVDTGSRGRKGHKGSKKEQKKRKRDVDYPGFPESATNGEAELTKTPKTAVAASTGFIHMLPPTPELWTTSLPHRTQVVYTPDYSYILHRLRARPGGVVIEAGAGSGSFTHAAARAVFNGYPQVERLTHDGQRSKKRRLGKVWSYEFHEQRVQKLKTEISDHGLNGIVHITHQDVCEIGFIQSHAKDKVQPDLDNEGEVTADTPQADAVFLDLPAPWLALRHLTRASAVKNALHPAGRSLEEQSSDPDPPLINDVAVAYSGDAEPKQTGRTTKRQYSSFESPLNPDTAVRLCTFSPCIEQVQRTISTLRQLGWIEIEMVEVAQKRIEVRRERVGVHEEGLRGVNPAPATIEEAVEKLKEVEGRFRMFHAEPEEGSQGHDQPVHDTEGNSPPTGNRQLRPGNIRATLVERKLYKEGRLVHRTEPELKTHTSYLVFALLPREWTAEDEDRCRRKWPLKDKIPERENENASRRQLKKAGRAGHGINKQANHTVEMDGVPAAEAAVADG